MRFIRDIIAEKRNTLDDEPSPQDDTFEREHETDSGDAFDLSRFEVDHLGDAQEPVGEDPAPARFDIDDDAESDAQDISSLWDVSDEEDEAAPDPEGFWAEEETVADDVDLEAIRTAGAFDLTSGPKADAPRPPQPSSPEPRTTMEAAPVSPEGTPPPLARNEAGPLVEDETAHQEPVMPSRPVQSTDSAPTTGSLRADFTDPSPEAETAAPVEMPRPAAGRSAGRSGRIKTRLLGFSAPQDSGSDPFQDANQKQGQDTRPVSVMFPVGWLVVIDGPGRGTAFALQDGVAQIGRNPEQAIPLAFGDTSISRENHAAIAYDDEQKAFFIGHGGKANLVRLNGRPVLSTEQIQSDDTIRIGQTTLRFIALCGEKFSWAQGQEGASQDAVAG